MTTDDKVLDYIQGRMTPPDQEAFAAQMAQDPDLKAEVTALLAARDSLAQAGQEVPPHGWDRLSDRIGTTAEGAANDNRPFRLSLLQAAGVAVAAVLGWQLVESVAFPSDTSGYVTASETADGPTLQIVFADSASVSQVSETLANLDGTIVAGPGALGIYTVAFPDEAARDGAMAILKDLPALTSDVLEN